MILETKRRNYCLCCPDLRDRHPGIQPATPEYIPLLPVKKFRTSDFHEFDYSGETRVHCLKLERRIIQLPLAEVSQVNFSFKDRFRERLQLATGYNSLPQEFKFSPSLFDDTQNAGLLLFLQKISRKIECNSDTEGLLQEVQTSSTGV